MSAKPLGSSSLGFTHIYIYIYVLLIYIFLIKFHLAKVGGKSKHSKLLGDLRAFIG